MRRRGATTALAAAILATLAGALPAQAHNSVVGSTPAEGQKVDSIPELTIYTNDALLDTGGTAGGNAIVISDEAGLYYGDGCVTVTVSEATTYPTLGPAGTYTVQYQLVSRDGHTISGEYSFEWSPTPDADQGPAYAEIPVCGEYQTPVGEEAIEPTEAPSPGVPGEYIDKPVDWTPVFIGLATMPLLIGAIWLFMRLLGKSDSEDHLN